MRFLILKNTADTKGARPGLQRPPIDEVVVPIGPRTFDDWMPYRPGCGSGMN